MLSSVVPALLNVLWLCFVSSLVRCSLMDGFCLLIEPLLSTDTAFQEAIYPLTPGDTCNTRRDYSVSLMQYRRVGQNWTYTGLR